MMLSFRTALKDALLIAAEQHPSLVVVTADLRKSLRLDEVQLKLGERFINVGICEANAISVAAGLATMGLLPVVVGFSVFTVLKPFEQIRQNVAYPKLNVKLLATHTGLSVGKDGASHQAIEDIAVMRSVPNMCVLSACDASQTKAAVAELLRYQGPVYLRLSRDNAEIVHGDEDHDFRIGGAERLRDGGDLTIMATGVMVKGALRAAERLHEEGIECRVLNLYSIKPLDESGIVESARTTGAVVTVEDHTTVGGLGGAISEVLAKAFPAPVEMVGLEDTFGESGTQEELFRKYHLGVVDIVQACRRVLSRKKADRRNK